jgi:isoprenylcysteine carboxyl methyltransferase (ICMT) family protein YpbQ
LIGLFIRVYTVGHTPANTSGRNTESGQMADSLNTTGIYSTVRHPLYLGNYLMWLGLSLLTGSLWFVIIFCLFYCIYYERIMYAEEQFLRKKFGTTYTEWANKTPAFFPRFRFFLKPNLPFSWKKVLKKEKNGFLALFLIFYEFDFVGEWLEKEKNYNYFLLIMCVISVISYCILKYLKKKTSVLDERGR